MRKLLIPIINKKAVFVRGPFLVLGSHARVEKLLPDEIGALFGFRPETYESLPAHKKALKVDLSDSERIASSDVARIVSAASFSLNFYSEKGTLGLSNAFEVKKNKRGHVTCSNAYNVLSHDSEKVATSIEFRLSDGLQKQTLLQFADLLSDSIRSDAALEIAVSRYNKALGRSFFQDKIIDLCICLEALCPASTEIAFQFALYNAWMISASPDGRVDAFNNLKTLYSLRSRLVHGNELKQKNQDWIRDHLDEVLEKSKRAVAYKALFLNDSRRSESWQEHLSGLALGSVSRIGD